MNKTVFSQKELLQEFGRPSNLGEIIRAIEERFSKVGEVVCQFRLNGLTLDEKDEARLTHIGFHEIETIEVETQRPELLLYGVLENWVRELPVLLEQSDKLAKEIGTSGMDGHLSQFVNLVDSCQLLVDSLISLEVVLGDQTLVMQPAWSKNKECMANAIGQALTAFEARDKELLAEVLEYDLGHALQVWLDLLQIPLKAYQKSS